jgi:hypothetical protein
VKVDTGLRGSGHMKRLPIGCVHAASLKDYCRPETLVKLS